MIASFSRCFALATLVIAQLASAQEETNPHKDTHWSWSANVTPTQMKQIIDNSGFRIIDLEVARESPLEFSVVWVKNDGPFRRSWWWYPNISGTEVDKFAQQNDAHLLDIEVVSLKQGGRFAAVYVKDPEPSKGWNWTAGSISMNGVGTYLKSVAAAKKRLIHLDPNANLPDYTTSIEAPNTGPAATKWWVVPTGNENYIASAIKDHNARLVHIERQPGNKFCVILVRSKGEKWWWFLDKTENEVETLSNKLDGRIIDIATHWRNGVQYFDFIMVGN